MWGANSLEKTVMLGKLEGRRRRGWQRLDGITNSVDMSLSKLREKWRTGRPGVLQGFPDGSAGKDSTCNVGDMGSIPELGRSPGEGNNYPFQYSGLENSMDYPWGHRVGHDWAHFTLTGFKHYIYLKFCSIKIICKIYDTVALSNLNTHSSIH